MEFEEQFPSLKNKAGMFHERDGNVESHIEWNDELGDLFHVEDIQEHCLDKAKEFHISSDEFHDLFVNGIVTTFNGLKLNATTEFKFGSEEHRKSFELFEKFRGEHLLLEEYKIKVKDVIDKELGIPHMQQARQLGKTWLVSFFVKKKQDIYKELGLK